MPVISISTVSPGFMLAGMPSVPIHITSPGSMVQYFDTSAVSVNYTPTLYIYNTAIAGAQYNLAAAGAVVLGVVIVAISVLPMVIEFLRHRAQAKREVEAGAAVGE